MLTCNCFHRIQPPPANIDKRVFMLHNYFYFGRLHSNDKHKLFYCIRKKKGIPGKVLLTPIWQIAPDIHDNNLRHVSIFALLSDIEDEYWIEFTNRRFTNLWPIKHLISIHMNRNNIALNPKHKDAKPRKIRWILICKNNIISDFFHKMIWHSFALL